MVLKTLAYTGIAIGAVDRFAKGYKKKKRKKESKYNKYKKRRGW